MPRAVLVDLEPGVHNSIANLPYGKLFNPDFIYHDQSSAGNVFASGFYSAGSEIIEEVMEGIRKQAEKCDTMEAFQITHSIGGGTGSGLGSLIMQEVKAEYPDKMLSSFSITPSKSVSDVVLEPYNSVLAFNHLIEECDSNILIDNEELYAIAHNQLKQKNVTFSFINKIVQRIILDSTSSLRFGGFNNAGMRKLMTNLCPFPRLHFLTTSLAPFTNSVDKKYDVVGANELCRDLFSSVNSRYHSGKFMTGATIFRGKIESSVCENSLAAMKQKNSGFFVEWIPDSLFSSICQVPSAEHPVSGILLANTTSVQNIFKRIDSQFEPMMKRRAFAHHYIQQGLDWSEMSEARMNMLDLINEYQQYEAMDAGEFEDEESDGEEVIQKTARSATGMSDHHSTHASSTKD